MSRWNLAWLIAVPLTVLTGFVLTYATPNKEREKDYKLVRTFVDVLALVDSKYVRELDEKAKEKLVEDMINGGLERLDRYSAYMNPEETKQFESQTEGNFGGVGIQLGVDPKSGMLMVISPMVGTPAYDAGILAGDIIIKIDDKTTENMRLNEAVKLIQGVAGSNVKLTVLHEASRESESFTITRARIEIKTVLGVKRTEADPSKWEWFIDDGIAYIRLLQFNEQSTKDLRDAIEAVEKAGAKALVLDLRDNPGGLLKSAIEVSDTFLSEGRIVSTRDRNGNGKSWEAKPDETLFVGKPMAVLINKNSASASEIVAAALQDNKRAVIVGERSFGKGSVQQVLSIKESDPPASLKLTTDTYWRPSGKNMHRYEDSKETDEWGVKPDPGMEVVLKDDERLEYLKFRRSRDLVKGKNAPPMPPKESEEKKEDKKDEVKETTPQQVPAAEQPKSPPAQKDDKKERKPFKDRALDKAVEYLKTQIK